jgi:hypothetical protein
MKAIRKAEPRQPGQTNNPQLREGGCNYMILDEHSERIA